jgi:hypothetical protein
MMRAALLVLLLAALAGCRPSFPFALRSAASGPRYFATQDVVFRLPGGEVQHLLTTVENDGATLTIVASSPLGQTLFILRTTEAGVAVDARVPLPKGFDPALLPTLVQLGDWPLEEVRRGLPPGMELQESGSRRTLLRRGRPFLELDREGQGPPWKVVTLRLPTLGMDATITTLDE